MAETLRNTSEIRRAHALTIQRQTLATPEPLLYVKDSTAKLMGLTPEMVVHPDYHPGYVFIHGKREVSDIRAVQEAMRGKRHDIDRPIVAVGADNVTPTLMVADNETDAYEIQDILGEQYEKQEKTIREQTSKSNKTPAINTDWVRLLNGAPIGQARADMVSEAFRERVRRHKQNPISDPARDPWKEAREKGLIPDNATVAVPDTYAVEKGSR